MRIILFCGFLMLTGVTWAGGTTVVTVGSSASCDYPSITAASFQEPASDLLEIRVPKDYSLNGLELLSDRRTRLRGGYDTCTDTTASGKTVLTGAGSHPIFIAEVAASTTVLTQLNMVDLEINGGNSTDNGGVINLIGSWELTVSNTTLRSNNSDQNGGAIAIQPNDDVSVLAPRVFVSGNSILTNNTANNGGAIACDGGGSVSVWNSQVAFNHADINGGAVYLNDSCKLYQYGAGLLQGIILNDADGNGGGVYASNNSLVYINSNARGTGPAMISSNAAGTNGGGVFVASESRIEAIDSMINNNSAALTGGGIRSSNGHVIVKRVSPGAQCHNEVRCSTISSNSVTSGSAASGGGGAIATYGGTLEIKGSYIENNSANFGSAIRARFMPFEFDSSFTMVGNVVAKNRNAPQVIYFDESSGEIAFTTFVDNEDMDRVIETSFPTTADDGHDVKISGSIFDHPGGTLPSAQLTSFGSPPVGDCNRNEPSSIGDLAGEPRSDYSVVAFEDRAGGDYRLQSGSTHLDFCNWSFLGVLSNVSANGFPKPVDDSSISNLYGTYDLGGLERYKLDLIFKDNF